LNKDIKLGSLHTTKHHFSHITLHQLAAINTTTISMLTTFSTRTQVSWFTSVAFLHLFLKRNSGDSWHGLFLHTGCPSSYSTNIVKLLKETHSTDPNQ